MRVLPRINEINASFGSIAGGQELVIKGQGLSGESSVTVDGVSCTVQQSSDTEIKCLTGSKSEASIEGYQPGQPGVVQTTINPEVDNQVPNINDRLLDTYTRTDVVTTSFEYHYNKLEAYSSRMTGFFKAPETGRYRFHLSADDASWFWLDDEQKSYPDADSPDPKVFQENDYICHRDYWCPLRRWYNELPELYTQKSEFITLEKDQFYPIEGYFIEGYGGDHMTVAVEYRPELQADEADKTAEWIANQHPQAASDVHLLEIENTGIKEEWTLDINVNADNIGRQFRINFFDPRSGEDKKDYLTG